MLEHDRTFLGTHLLWPFERRKRPFEIRVVEPKRYAPAEHSTLFNAALTAAFSNDRDVVDLHTRSSLSRSRFDLITFPEAFLPVATLLDTLDFLEESGPSGCIHAGLRPDGNDDGSHLFATAELRNLSRQIQEKAPCAGEDLAAFDSWLAQQPEASKFNVGAFLLIDADSRLRVCLHPKLVRSRFETSALPDDHMDEANLLTLITLCPRRVDLGTLTIQPLICSDALDLSTDSERGPPMAAVHTHADCMGDAPPNHVDIVSVATCTPQAEGQFEKQRYRAWHGKFQNAFIAASQAPGYARHHFASIVLSNFLNPPGQKGGGLSGVYLPLRPDKECFQAGLSIETWGRPKNKSRANNSWSYPYDNAETDWDTLGFVTGLDPFSEVSISDARLLSATINRLPRERPILEPDTTSALTKIEVFHTVSTPDHKIQFVAGGARS